MATPTIKILSVDHVKKTFQADFKDSDGVVYSNQTVLYRGATSIAELKARVKALLEALQARATLQTQLDSNVNVEIDLT